MKVGTHRSSQTGQGEDETGGRLHLVHLTPQSTGAADTLSPYRFRNDALDEMLRERVHSETGERQTALIQGAMRDTRPRLGSKGVGSFL